MVPGAINVTLKWRECVWILSLSLCGCRALQTGCGQSVWPPQTVLLKDLAHHSLAFQIQK